VTDAATGESVEFDGATTHASGWSRYPQTVVRRCALNFPAAAGGADIAFASDLPQAAGLSSSSALVVAVFLALDAVRGVALTPEYRSAIASTEDLAGYLGAVENGMSFGTLAGDAGVGTMGGSEDHTAILCARPGHLVQYSYAPVRFEGEVPLPAGFCFAIASSGVRAEKAGAALQSYNRLSAATRRLVELWRGQGAGDAETLADIVAGDGGALRLREIVHQYAPAEVNELLPRLAQFVIESEEIVPGARAALARDDLPLFAEFVRRSQVGAEQSLRNQIPETIGLVRGALAHGAVAASAFGAGFGGSVWALVSCDRAEGFLAAWRADYAAAFSEHRDAEFFVTPASGPAARLELSGRAERLE
jgi:galactokinase